VLQGTSQHRGLSVNSDYDHEDYFSGGDWVKKTKKTRWAILSLFLLAPVCGELLSGSAPPMEFFNPTAFLIMTALYGSGAVLIRDVVRRWKKGWLAIFLLGMAYGIYEEGIVVRSFFDPTWHDLELLARYGRFAGVNWIWSLCLTLFHATVSILLPILIVELFFPAIRKKVWVRVPGLIGFWCLFLMLIPVGWFMGMRANLLQIGLSLLSILILTALAYVPEKKLVILEVDFRPGPPWLAGLLSFCGMMGLFLVMWIFPAINFPWPVDFLLGAFLPLVYGVIAFIAGSQNWDDRHGWSAAFGALLPWILLTFLAEAQNAIRSDNTRGMTWVGFSFLGLFALLRWFIHRRRRFCADEQPKTQHNELVKL
jgi:hypothetical protein